MSLADLWSRTLVYFGIAEEDEEFYDDEEVYTAEETLEQSYRERPNVRRLTPRRRGQEFDDWTESAEAEERGPAGGLAPQGPGAAVAMRPHIEAVPNPNAVRVHLILPRSFNDAQQIADKFKQGIPVILNLQSADTELSKRLIDFASGLTYALNGGMQRVADKVFLLTPRNVEVSAEQRASAPRARRLLQPGVGILVAGPKEGAAMLLDAISQVQLFVTVFASVYALALVLYVLLSWVRLPPSFGPGAALPPRCLRAVHPALAQGCTSPPARSTSRRWWRSSRSTSRGTLVNRLLGLLH